MKLHFSTVGVLVLISLVLRACVGLWGYSGYGNPPMFGDFEAQRHWMEITTHLPMEEWYRNSTDNDLQYWGLDYPPLTAFVSKAFGAVAHSLCPDLVALHTSRGHESAVGKLFMRASVLFSDVLVLFPVIAIFVSSGVMSTIKSPEAASMFVQCVFSPALILIDHGHFQYNGVSIALALAGGASILNGYDVWGSIFFCLSLNFKQMGLYYAPVFFFCLLRKCLEKSKRVMIPSRQSIFTMLQSYAPALGHLLAVGGSVLATFTALWAPFCVYQSGSYQSCLDIVLQILHRIFPFSRGIFEDKVSNIWYTLSVVYDFRTLVSGPVLIRASLALTLLLLAPTAIDLLRNPLSQNRLVLSLINSALAFFLASFQVHEKSLLLALVPATLVIQYNLVDVGWFQFVGCMTMFPLLVRDGQSVPYFATMVLYGIILAILSDRQIAKQFGMKWSLQPVQDGGGSSGNSNAVRKSRKSQIYVMSSLITAAIRLLRYMFMFISCAGFILLHLLYLTVPPPAIYPDLYPALFSIFGCCNLIWYYGFFVAWQWNLEG